MIFFAIVQLTQFTRQIKNVLHAVALKAELIDSFVQWRDPHCVGQLILIQAEDNAVEYQIISGCSVHIVMWAQGGMLTWLYLIYSVLLMISFDQFIIL